MSTAPIGIFDSGLGGLTVARAVIDHLPHESTVYLGDTHHAPYGPRPIAEVRRLALDSLDALMDRGVKALVIACNSASAAVLHDARERYSVPVIEVIRPAARRAAGITRTGAVGVISTQATHTSGAYRDAFAAVPSVQLRSQPCPRFVHFVESGTISGPEVFAAATEYLQPLKEAGVDTLILGCTHYPLLRGVIAYEMGPEVSLVSSAEETAAELLRTLADRGELAPDATVPTHEFLTTGDPSQFSELARRFLGPEVSALNTHRLPVETDVPPTGSLPVLEAGDVR
ncbi:glutamate racemase [Kytococcus sedentarius]|uniref:Glutamate racemase n=1 Tax=Kytococcus sedentarius (strain ATCC 14392 / DSM 20547 / JCM 11482 / CCUG 33030 / NBRC 15357 / NCTC 11040 / CCM 314 / 541) TaxID=478801 RepID=C7NG38_KYTSD|nr:glutamate racemase [Kytococcus sedentarius]ACV06038.1 glutamate racemase [Kytococcus sedentarius DSM 20547]QQB64408.1 glutamate racemase [Kytococcus sedentarius]STX12544.1 Glutamate racemase 1 [Kytococcus sedentarius]